MPYRLLIALPLLGLAAARTRAQGPPEALAVQARVVLKKHCFDCHGKNAVKPKGKLNLFDRAQLEDRERKIVVAGKPEASLLVEQVEKGEMPPEERPRLSAAEKKVLREWVAAGAPPLPPEGGAPPNAGAAKAPPVDRPAQAKEIFRRRCLECHGGRYTKAGIKILDRARLVTTRVVPGRPEESDVFRAITATDGDKVMPPAGQPRLRQDEIDTIRLWIAEGAGPFPPDVAVPAEPQRDPPFKDVAGVDYVLKKILAHVRTVPTSDRPFRRYFSLNHILVTGASAEALAQERDALAKAINHLSWEARIVRPVSIDPPTDSIYCIDLRDLGWHRQPFDRVVAGGGAAEVRKGKSDLNFFDTALLEYPYGIVYEDSETFDRLVEEYLLPAAQVRPVVYVRSDWFVSTITQPPFYEDFLRLPFELKELEHKLGVDSAADVAQFRAARGGMVVSGVSKNNRVVERHPSNYGAYWKSFDFFSSKGAENIFRDPIDLHPAGGEMIFNLPNGLQGYFVVNAQGVRIEAAATEIVTDRFAEDKTVRNGLACMRCHDQGMKGFLDVVRPALMRLPGSPGFDKKVALELYPEQRVLDGWLKEDGDRFQAAMAKVLGKPPAGEPLVPVSHRFLDDPIPLTAAAGELALTDPAGLQAVFRVPQFTGLGLVPLAADGVVRRDAWEDYFDQVVRTLGLGIPIPPVDGLSRKDFPSGPPPVEVELKTNKKSSVFEPGDEIAFLVTNKGRKAIYIELIGTSARGRSVILAPSTTMVGPGETYRYPPQGGLKARGGLGKEQVTLFARATAFPGGEVLRGDGVTDRVVHPFFQIRKVAGRWRLTEDAQGLVRKTIEIETK